MSVINNNLLLTGDDGGYQISRSVRLRSSASAYFNRTPASAGNRKTWTWSGWVKRGALGTTAKTMFSAGTNGSSARGVIDFNDSNTLRFGFNDGSSWYIAETTAVFRDPSAWYHVVVKCDLSNATQANRAALYVNGVQQATNAVSWPNADQVFNNTVFHGIGRNYGDGTYYFDGYLTDINFIDGQALDASSFGETNADTGVWQPIEYAGTYGTNGFYLNFSDPASTTTIGYDYSGNGNNWTSNNISVTAGVTYDSMIDTPTPVADERGNFAVLNPLAANVAGTVRDGNLTLYQGSPSHSYALSSITLDIPVYAEMLANTTYSDAALGLGIQKASTAVGGTQDIQFYSNVSSQLYLSGALQWYSTLFVTNDIIQIAFDPSTGKVWLGRNNTWYNSSGGTTGDPSTGANPTATLTTGIPYVVVVNAYQHVAYMNFGQRPFSYTPPTGFKALQTGNLPEPTIVDGSQYFDATIWSGDNTASRTITNTYGFAPDFVWTKTRNSANSHLLYDKLRGPSTSGGSKSLTTNGTNAEGTINDNSTYGYLSSFETNGFGVTKGSNDQYVNRSGNTYVAWQWKANGAGVSNTDGTITSTVSAGVTQGFSVVTYTGTGSAATVGHGLGVAPSMVIAKPRSQGDSWAVYFATLGVSKYLLLDTTAAATTSTNFWNPISTSSFGVSAGGLNNRTGATHIAYCFAEVPGFSKFGSYTGNGSTDGPFVFCGFRPAFVMVKRTDAVSNWNMADNQRPSYNPENEMLLANSSSAALTSYPVDFTANGFKMRNTEGGYNTSGGTYIFMAMAESPFKTSLAR